MYYIINGTYLYTRKNEHAIGKTEQAKINNCFGKRGTDAHNQHTKQSLTDMCFTFGFNILQQSGSQLGL